MFTYAQIEDALARVHRQVPRGALRGRIKRFRGLGLVPSSPGRGKHITYTREHAYFWALCFELSQFGFDPTAVKTFVGVLWDVARPPLLDLPKGRPDPLLFFLPTALGRSFVVDGKDVGQTSCVIGDASSYLLRASFPRIGVINLGVLHRAMETALQEACSEGATAPGPTDSAAA